jgi:hypothetical protein
MTYVRTQARRGFLTLLLALLPVLPEAAKGQGIGLPLLSDSSGQPMLAVAAGQRERVIGGWSTISRIAYGRAAFGLGGQVDVFAGVGLLDLRLLVPGGEMTSSPALAYGVGLNARLLRVKRIGLSLLANASLWRSQPEVSADLGGTNGGAFERLTVLHYDWREASGGLALGKTWGPTEWYAGVSGYMIQRRESRWAVLRTSGTDVKGPVSSGEFRSGFVAQMVVGVDLHLPQGFKLSLEIEGRDRSNFGVLFGVSQTGSPR